jgi:hypothetical protein
MATSEIGRGRHLAALAAVAVAIMLPAGAASAATFAPPKGKIFAGVSDTGSKRHYFEFTAEVGRHVPVMQSFEAWGGILNESKRRWKRTETRGMLSISTSPCYQCAEVISPQAIRQGFGDAYLLRLNEFLAEWGKPTYIRLLPEMNGYWNPYGAFNSDGSSRGFSHKTKQFRKAWKRVVLIARGGRRGRINRSLRRQRMPKIRRGRKVPRRLPRTKASFLWVPQTHGSPGIRKNRPAAYWPGRRYVDWVGADIYGKFPNFAGLERLYRSRKRVPFVIGEWAPWDVDSPGFTNALHEWVESHRRAKMLVYYQGFGENNPFMIQRYPASADALASQLDNRRYKRFAPDSRRKKKPGGGGGGGVGPAAG